MYNLDMSGWTADRTVTLPTTAAVGDKVGVTVKVTHATKECLLTAASSDTLNGVAGGSEWSRVFITNEVVIMRCITANSVWVVEHDGRIPQKCSMRLSTGTSNTESAATFSDATAISGVWTADVDNASLASVSNDRIILRRGGIFSIACGMKTNVAVGLAAYNYCVVFLTGTTIAAMNAISLAGAAGLNGQCFASRTSAAIATDDYLRYRFVTSEGARGLSASSGTTDYSASWFTAAEIL
jgi:hypothetical protein